MILNFGPKATNAIDLSYLKSIQNENRLLEEQTEIEISKIYYQLYTSAWDKKYIDQLIKEDFISLLVKIFDRSYEHIKNTYQNLPKEQKLDIFKNEKSTHLPLMENASSLLRNLSFYSIESNQEIQNQDGVRILLKLIGDNDLLDTYSLIFNENMIGSESFADILSNAIGGLENLAMNSTSFTAKWKESNAVQIIFNFSEKFKHVNDWKLNAYLSVASVSSDEEIDKLPSLHTVIEEIIHVISLGAKAIKSGLVTSAKINGEATVKRAKIPIKDSNESKEVCMIYLFKDPTGWSISELFEGLYHMAINDSVKNDIYTKYSMCEHLRSIIYNGNETEVSYAIKLLWQLSFDQRVLKHVCEDMKLVGFIKELIERNFNKLVTDNSKGLLFRLDSNKVPTNTTNETGEKHIMISYNSANRDTCLKIKEQLEKMNFKVWIDVSSIHGSSLDSMAKAIENSFCVLICMSEKYKMSNNCRAEAEYTFQINKPFIPIKV